MIEESKLKDDIFWGEIEKLENELQKAVDPKIHTQLRISIQYAIFFQYFKYLESPHSTAQQLKELHERYKAWVEEPGYKVQFRLHAEDKKLFCLIRLEHTEAPSQFLSFELKNKFNKLIASQYSSIRGESEGDEAFIHYSSFSSAYLKLPILTHLSVFNVRALIKLFESYSSLLRFSDLFNKKTIIQRIVLAVLLDNPSLLAEFLSEHKQYSSQSTEEDEIDDFGLMGIAAVNGCVEVVKFFIAKKINLEKKFIVNMFRAALATNDSDLPVSDQASALAKYPNSLFEMTVLGLAVSIIPALSLEKARELIEVLLSAGAKFNIEIERKFLMSSLFNEGKKIEKTVYTNLIEFDQTGILKQEIMKLQTSNIKEEKKVFLGAEETAIPDRLDHCEDQKLEIEKDSSFNLSRN